MSKKDPGMAGGESCRAAEEIIFYKPYNIFQE
jgi:hypothetical protein